MQAPRLFSITTLAAVAGLGLATLTTSCAATSETPTSSSSASQAVSDTWITAKVKTEIATTIGLKTTDVSVTTNDGVVALTGDLPTELDVKKAVAAARSVKGVREVDSSGLKSKG
ncbi:MAG TPA: BON domain-containing protein [Acidiphilium sp.]